MEKIILILLIVLFVITLGFLMLRSISKTLTYEEVITQILFSLDKVMSNNHITGAILTIYSDKNNYNETFTSGTPDRKN